MVQIVDPNIDSHFLYVLFFSRHGQSVLPGAGGVGLGLENQKRERWRLREGSRGVAEQTPDRVSAALRKACHNNCVCLTCSFVSIRAHYIILLVESVLFGVFVLVIFYDQVLAQSGLIYLQSLCLFLSQLLTALHTVH